MSKYEPHKMDIEKFAKEFATECAEQAVDEFWDVFDMQSKTIIEDMRLVARVAYTTAMNEIKQAHKKAIEAARNAHPQKK